MHERRELATERTCDKPPNVTKAFSGCKQRCAGGSCASVTSSLPDLLRCPLPDLAATGRIVYRIQNPIYGIGRHILSRPEGIVNSAQLGGR
jgi:hypothetical protein